MFLYNREKFFIFQQNMVDDDIIDEKRKERRKGKRKNFIRSSAI